MITTDSPRPVYEQADIRLLCHARRVPDRPVNHLQPRSVTDKSQPRSPGLMQVIARVGAAFQASDAEDMQLAKMARSPSSSRAPRWWSISASSLESIAHRR
jgi:hypothetical protein